MKRDTVKTLAGLVVIAVIVIATFIYGNSQRQAQVKQDNNVKQQDAKASATPDKSASPLAAADSPTPKPATTPTPAGTSANTAPVESPKSNNLQGGSASTPTPSPSKSPTPSPSSGAVAGAQTVPQTGASNQPLPQTGAPNAGIAGMIGMTAMVFAAVVVRRSRRAVESAARSVK